MSGYGFLNDPQRWVNEHLAPAMRSLVQDEVRRLLAREVPEITGRLLRDAFERQVAHTTLADQIEAAVRAEVERRKEAA